MTKWECVKEYAKRVHDDNNTIEDKIDFEDAYYTSRTDFTRLYQEYRNTVNELENFRSKYYDLLEKYNKLIEADIEGMRGPYDQRLRILEDKVRDLMAGFNCDGYCD
jgi:cyclopropane fatty-acyl-phospholipid synthase-like methyltransferase